MTLSELVSRRDALIKAHAKYTTFISTLGLPALPKPGIDTVITKDTPITLTIQNVEDFYSATALHFYDHGFEAAFKYLTS